MKKASCICILMLMALVCVGQDKVDAVNTISSVDYVYDDNNDLNIFLILKQGTLPSDPNLATFSATLSASITWEAGIALSKSITSISFTNDQNYKFSVVLKASDGTRIKEPAAGNPVWRSIDNVKITYQLGGITTSLPTFNVYPKIPKKIPGAVPKLKTDPTGEIVADNEVTINVTSDPQGLPIELTEIKLTGPGAGAGSVTIPANEIVPSFALNGTFKARFRLLNVNGGQTYTVKVTGKVITTGAAVNSDPPSSVTFVDAKPLRPINLPNDFTLSIRGTDELSFDVNTNAGRGKLGIQFLSTEFNSKIRPEISNVGSLYTIKLKSLLTLSKTSSSFWLTVDQDIKYGPYTIEKEAPGLTDFKFDITSPSVVKTTFKLPSWADEVTLSLKDAGIIITAPNVTRKPNPTPDKTPTEFQIVLSDAFYNKLKKDTVIESPIAINVKGSEVFSLTVVFFNQKLMNDKMNELIKITAEKKPDEAKLKKVLNDIVKIAEKVGAVVTSDEVKKAVDTLAEKKSDKEKTEKVLTTIAQVGKWVTTLGPIVIPLLL